MSAQGRGPESRRTPRSNLHLRIVSALVLGILVLGATYLGGIAFRLLAAAMAGFVLHEWMHMRPPAPAAHRALAWSVLALALAALLAGFAAPVAFAVLAAGILALSVQAGFLGLGFWSVWGIAYAGVPAIALSALRDTAPGGLALVLYLFAVVWATDVVAYFVGRAMGGPKLAPAISPGKTWSGAVGGTIGAVLAGIAAAVLIFGARPAYVSTMAAVALALSVAAQAGDLLESAIKRRHGVKDSGTLIPGHGGVMDRVDGLVAAAVLLYVLAVLNSAAGAAILLD